LKTRLWGLSSPESPVALSGFIVRSGYMDHLIHRIISLPIKGSGSSEMTLHGYTAGAISILMKGVSANFAPPPPSFSNVVPVLLGRIDLMHSIQKVVTRKRKGDDDAAWTYWVTRPVTERLAMVEELRAEYHGWTIESEPRLLRVCRIVRRS
jgi:hypothetical protein